MRKQEKPANGIVSFTRRGTQRTWVCKEAAGRVLIRGMVGDVAAIDKGARNNGGGGGLADNGSSVWGGDDCHAAPSCKGSDLFL